MPSPFPIWYLEAHFPDGRVASGSAVPVYVKKSGAGSRAFKVLLTAQHVIRQDVTAAPGTYSTDIRAWIPGEGFAEENSKTVEPLADLCPDPALPFQHHEDFAFLRLPPDVDPEDPCVLLEDEQCEDGLEPLVLCGFPGGAAHLKINGFKVDAAEFREWRWAGVNSGSRIAILAPGEGVPRAGVSGGGVFHENRYTGIYRGMFGATGEHIMLTVKRLREWCHNRGYSMVSAGVENRKLPWKKWLPILAAVALAALIGGALIYKTSRDRREKKAEQALMEKGRDTVSEKEKEQPAAVTPVYLFRGRVVAQEEGKSRKDSRPLDNISVTPILNEMPYSNLTRQTNGDGIFEIEVSDSSFTGKEAELKFESNNGKFKPRRIAACAVSPETLKQSEPRHFLLEPK